MWRNNHNITAILLTYFRLKKGFETLFWPKTIVSSYYASVSAYLQSVTIGHMKESHLYNMLQSQLWYNRFSREWKTAQNTANESKKRSQMYRQAES